GLAEIAELAVREPQQPRAPARSARPRSCRDPAPAVRARAHARRPAARLAQPADRHALRARLRHVLPRRRAQRVDPDRGGQRGIHLRVLVGGSASATLYVPAGMRSAAAMAAPASSSQSVGRYAPGGPTAIDAPPRAACTVATEEPLSG